MRRLGALALSIGLVLVGTTACGGGSSESVEDECANSGCIEIGPKDPIRLGALLWLETLEDETGRDTLRGVELAVDYLDWDLDGIDGDLLGHRVLIDTADDGCDPVAGSVGAERLLARGTGLIGAIGTTCSGSALGAADVVFARAGLPLISPSNTAPSLTEPGKHAATYLRTAPNDRIQGEVDANFARLGLRSQRAATISTPTPYPAALAEVFAEAYRSSGGEIVATASFEVGASPDVAVAEVAAAAPDVVFVPVQTTEACSGTIARLRAEPRLAAARIITADGCLTSATLATLGRDPNRPVYASGPDSDTVMKNAFYAQQLLPAYTSLYGTEPPGVWHPHAFDATTLLFDALRRAARVRADGSILIVKRDLMRELRRADGFEGVSGTLECRPTGDCAQAARIAIYASPAWPVSGGDANARPVFSQQVTLADALD
ncbi:MAG: branched-chain amino acid ABC transporter substrate-binding protein [Actinomycetes bacterium]